MRITLCDVGPRDGLQNDPVQLEPAVRAELVDRLSETGLPRIETTSFVNPKAVPRMAGAADPLEAHRVESALLDSRARSADAPALIEWKGPVRFRSTIACQSSGVIDGERTT